MARTELKMEENACLISQQLDGNDDEDYERHFPIFSSNRNSCLPHTISSLLTLLATVAIFSAILTGLTIHILNLTSPSHLTSSPSPTPASGSLFGNCGDTVNDAMIAGCIYDVMSSIWLPPACTDSELTQQFLALKNWTWWHDRNMTHVVPFTEVQAGKYKALWVTREFHWYHCTYMWRKLHRGLLKGVEDQGGDANEKGRVRRRGVTDSYIGQYHHTAHCEGMLVDETPGQVVDTVILRKIGKCMWL